jgi:hypothetical protein
MWIVDTISLISNNLGLQPRHIFHQGRTFEELLSFFIVSLNTLNENIHDSNYFYSYFNEGMKDRFHLLPIMIDLLLNYYYLIKGSDTKSFPGKILSESQLITTFIKDVPLLLQEGKDQDAINLISKIMFFSEILNIVLAKLKVQAEEQTKINALNKELLEYFEAVYQSMKNQDVVTVSDLMEYEIFERYNTLIQILRQSLS